MSRFDRPLTGTERTFAPDEIIVSKTDRFGKITYANEVFCRVAGYTEAELLGQPHSIVRHPEMPRCVFSLLWETIGKGREIFAYVVNRSSNGDHYWVFAHVTPTFNRAGTITGYHSSRRVPNRQSVDTINPIYAELRRIEQQHTDHKVAIAASTAALVAKLASAGMSYDEFVFSLPTEAEGIAA
jgi:PAS domain S-box-containing protein